MGNFQDNLLYQLRRNVKELDKKLAAGLEPFKLSITRFLMLWAVKQKPSQMVNALARDMEMDARNAHDHLNVLEASGYVLKKRVGSPPKSLYVMTEKGDEVMDKAHAFWMSIGNQELMAQAGTEKA